MYFFLISIKFFFILIKKNNKKNKFSKYISVNIQLIIHNKQIHAPYFDLTLCTIIFPNLFSFTTTCDSRSKETLESLTECFCSSITDFSFSLFFNERINERRGYYLSNVMIASLRWF